MLATDHCATPTTPPAVRSIAPSGRGSAFRYANPHVRVRLEPDSSHGHADDSLHPIEGRPRTEFLPDHSHAIVNRNESRDLPFRWSVNPYRGCEHGCSYCYARPTHEFLGLDAGLGFETQIVEKPDAPALLRKWLTRPGWEAEPIVFSGVTDCYQPREREVRITRQCLEVAAECRQPIGVITKNALVTRDKDLLADLASDDAAVVAVSLTTLDEGLARRMEPRTSTPSARLRAMAELAEAGVPMHAMLSPIVPGLNDHELPRLLSAACDAGAASASYTLLRLAGSTRDVFLEWLRRCEPTRARRVEELVRGTRNGRWNDSRFGERMIGVGPYAAQIGRTFRVFTNRLGLQRAPRPLSGEAFCPPGVDRQLPLF